MDIQEILLNVIYIAIKYRMPGSKESILSLLKKSGYFETYDQIDEEMLNKALAYHPECAYAWLFYSEDQRSSSTWYFKQNDQGNYIVAYYPPEENLEVIEHSNIRRACAAFIKRTIEDVRKLQSD